ncbi:MAG TPA: class I SAM-dependent methyltransferase [Rhizomicrobium sp.]|nr:class I SAM-dependent methyltransferase [Rhizomicrobium sp.]
MADQLPLKAGDRVLDIGCGPGWFWTAVADSLPGNLHLTLADLSPGMVQEAMERCRASPFASVESRRADAAALPFADDSFDAVIAMHMLYHLPDPAAGIAEITRVLKPGGFAAVTTNGSGNMRKLHQLAAAFGGEPRDPSAAIFGFEAAERLLGAQFGNVTLLRHPAKLRITEPEDVFLALTSYPPGDQANEIQLAALRRAIADAFREGGGVLEVEKEGGLFLSRKNA